MKPTSQSTDSKVTRRIRGHGRGWVFTPDHFKDLGSRDAVASTLKRLKQRGTIRQLDRGLYDFPKTDPRFGPLHPSSDDVVKALGARDGIQLQPSGAHAANLLGLSTQVPMKSVYLTDGRSRDVTVGKRKIVLKRTSPRYMATAGRVSGLVIQALRHLGQDRVDDAVVAQLRRRLDDQAKAQLLKDARFAPAWIADIFHAIADTETVS